MPVLRLKRDAAREAQPARQGVREPWASPGTAGVAGTGSQRLGR